VTVAVAVAVAAMKMIKWRSAQMYIFLVTGTGAERGISIGLLYGEVDWFWYFLSNTNTRELHYYTFCWKMKLKNS
jgi:hypothetical protein